MRRPLPAVLTALLGVLSLASPAQAQGSTDIVIGSHDGSFVVRSVPTEIVGAALRRAEARDEVAWAEVDVTFSAARVTPNDPLFPQQWGVQKVRAPEAWARSTGDSSVVVAVVDSGVDATHPDLAGQVLAGADFVNDGLSGDPAGHGTGVAGVLAARGNNGTGMAGVCWACKILPVRVLDREGNGSASNIAAGITWAVNRGAKIINLSLAGDRSSSTLELAIADARAKGALVVAAAGNRDSSRSSVPITTPQYPAASPGVIGVVATDPGDAAYPWSFQGSWADVAAPGCVLSTVPGGRFAEQCGTSFAAPAVAGMLGLAIGGFPTAPFSTIESSMYSTAVPMPSGASSRGRVDAGALLDTLAAQFAPPSLVPERVAGVNRIATSVALSKKSFAGAETVIIARSDQYVDALIAAPLAGRLGAPVLLTTPAGLDPAVAAEVERLGARTAWLVGGTDALSAAVDSGLAAAGVTNRPRLGGSTPAARAATIAKQLGSQSVYVAQVGGWPDAVSVSGLAALTEQPILLVERDRVPAVTADVLTSSAVTDVTIVGGTAVVSPEVEAALGSGGRTVQRLFGANRYETSRAVATAALAAGADARSTWFATGVDWPDALSAGPASARRGAVLLLLDGKGTTGTGIATTWLKGVSGLREVVIVGGEAAVASPVVASIASVLPR